MRELDFIRIVRGASGVRSELVKLGMIFFMAFLMGGLSMALGSKTIKGKISPVEKQKIIDAVDDNVLIFTEAGGIIKVENISQKTKSNS